MYSLVGINGNAYSTMSYVSKAMRRERRSQKEIDNYFSDAMSSNYDHLLSVSQDMIDSLNKEVEDEQ